MAHALVATPLRRVRL